MPTKPASQRRLIGRPVAALDIPPKTTGAARYGIDAKVEGMVYARPKVPPTRNDSKVRSIDDSAARSVKGYISSLALDDPSNTVPGWVMVFAETYPAALERFAFLRWFRGILVSGEVGLIKPDPRIFALLIERFAIEPQRAVYIDDVEANVAAARRFGVHGIHFTTPARLWEELVALGLLPSRTACSEITGAPRGPC